MRNPDCIPEDVKKKGPEQKGLPGRPAGEPTPEELQEELRKYLRYLPQVAEPSLARVWEIKAEIQKGTYLRREMIEETAGRLALRFLRKE